MNDQPVDLPALVTALGDAFGPITPVEQQLAREIYRTLLTGHAATVADLAARLHTDAQRLSDSVHRWPGVYLDSHQRITGFWGLALAEMAHRITVEATTTFAWCAFDPLFILPLLGTTGSVTSRCPITAEPVSLTITPEGIRDLTPGEAVVSMLAPTGRFDAQVRTTFCHYVLFFASPEAGRAWTSAHPGTFLLPATDAFDLAQRVNQAAFPVLTGDTMRP
jgi:alkylmercury lyase